MSGDDDGTVYEVCLIAPVLDGIKYLKGTSIYWGVTYVETQGKWVGRRSWTGETVAVDGALTIPWTNVAGVRESEVAVEM